MVATLSRELTAESGRGFLPLAVGLEDSARPTTSGLKAERSRGRRLPESATESRPSPGTMRSRHSGASYVRAQPRPPAGCLHARCPRRHPAGSRRVPPDLPALLADRKTRGKYV